MSQKLDIVRAWKDEEYVSNLTDSQRAMLPENPAGLIELSDADLHGAVGGNAPTTPTIILFSLDPFCQSLMFSCITLGCTVTLSYQSPIIDG